MKKILIALILICDITIGLCQSKKDIPKYLGDPLIVDSSSSSMLMIPLFYKLKGVRSGNDIRDNHFANILFYNFKSDSNKRLFEEDTYIKPIQFDYIPAYCYRNSVYSSKWIFYFVKSSDYNNNGRIDIDDPYILYVSDKQGNRLKSITPVNENILSIDIFEKQGFALIKLQQDTNGNKKFGINEERDFYYIRLDLNTLTLQGEIDMKF